ncbi:MAG: hypothetical protein EOS52_07230 [Mesorhizobium sp.]|uniref:hypothetical protein n=1 Tax=Mesorhizobium sp. TaxID=1871066 RepID=UPI000FEA349F|nr:hypothetical protein [Mesorhizobium sp.]RWC15937.1 MAG: hypothetical protein EOS52_07230 [Mesorhizobium sp.]
MYKSGFGYALMSSVCGLLGTGLIGMVLAELGLSERAGLLVGAALMCAASSVFVYGLGVDEGKANSAN